MSVCHCLGNPQYPAAAHPNTENPMKEIALITLHGMGKVKPDYADDLVQRLRQRLGPKWAGVSVQHVQYAPILQAPQDQLWSAMTAAPGNKLDATALRQFLLFGFGDAGSLEHSAHTDKVQYLAVQREIRQALDRALQDFEGDATKPVVIIAQSLGCQVISNYIWDAQKGKGIFSGLPDADSPEDGFRKLKTLARLVTTGCNIPLFIAGLAERTCFKKPNDSFAWDNYYDQDDVLGWPLRQLGETYHIVSDHPINAGGIISSWNPVSHGKYWSDKDVLLPLGQFLAGRIP